MSPARRPADGRSVPLGGQSLHRPLAQAAAGSGLGEEKARAALMKSEELITYCHRYVLRTAQQTRAAAASNMPRRTGPPRACAREDPVSPLLRLPQMEMRKSKSSWMTLRSVDYNPDHLHT